MRVDVAVVGKDAGFVKGVPVEPPRVNGAGFKDLRIRVHRMVDATGVRPLHRVTNPDEDGHGLEGEIDDGNISHASLASIGTRASTAADLNSPAGGPSAARVAGLGGH